MKYPKMFVWRQFLVATACMVAGTGCLHDRIDGSDPSELNGEVVFSFSIPGKAIPATRAMTPEQENEIASIELLLIDPGSGKVKCAPVCVDKGKINPDSGGKNKFKVRLPAGKADIMIFANSAKAFGSSTPKRGDSREDALDKLRVEMPVNGWTKGADYQIPMWGEAKGIDIGGDNPTFVKDVSLHRMVARIDVKVLEPNGDTTKTGNFTILKIKLHNAQKEGRIAPLPANWTDKDETGRDTTPHALRPSTVEGCDVVDPISYDFDKKGGTKESERDIYLFEAPKASGDADHNAVFLTVYGTYKREPGWYRIDLANYNDRKYLDVLRNYLYKVLIDRVNHRGFDNEQEAIDSRTVDVMDVEINMWNELELGGTAFEGPHFLSIFPQDIFYDSAPYSSEKLKITTDDESPLSLSDVLHPYIEEGGKPGSDIDWIYDLNLVSQRSENKRNYYELTYKVKPNPDKTQRTGYIEVRLHELRNYVRIRQGGKDDAPGDIALFPRTLTLSAKGDEYGMTTVMCSNAAGKDDPQAEWTLSMAEGENADRFRLSTAPDTGYAGAAGKISGKGTSTVYVWTLENTSILNTYAGTAVLNGGPLLKLEQEAKGAPNTPQNGGASSGGTFDGNMRTYVGAFWKKKEKGERVINIFVGDNSGEWKASVTEASSGFLSDIMLVNGDSSDPNIRTYKTPGDAEKYPVTESESTREVSGKVEKNGYITFRIGLRSYAAGNRYAVVMLTYNDGKKAHKIFLRQGEDPDKLYDRYNSPDATWSPYNVNSAGAFSTYPSCSGCLYQWGARVTKDHEDYWKKAWNAYDRQDNSLTWKDTKIVHGWGYSKPNESIKNANESSPTGYCRPSDGPTGNGGEDEYINDKGAGLVSTSNMRHLWNNTPDLWSGAIPQYNNSLWGYYADGFFDRRPIVDAPGDNIGRQSTVLSSGVIGNMGRIFFNTDSRSDHYNYSLFLPAAGYREEKKGALTGVGRTGRYWSTARTKGSQGSALIFDSESVRMSLEPLASAGSIRPVRR